MITCCQIIENYEEDFSKTLNERKSIGYNKAILNLSRLIYTTGLQFLLLEKEANKKGNTALCSPCSHFFKNSVKLFKEFKVKLKAVEKKYFINNTKN